MSPPGFEAGRALLFLRTCGSQCQQTHGSAFRGQFSADAPLRGVLQASVRRMLRGTLARAQSRAGGLARLRLLVFYLYSAPIAAAIYIWESINNICQQKHHSLSVSFAALPSPDGEFPCTFILSGVLMQTFVSALSENSGGRMDEKKKIFMQIKDFFQD